MGGLYGCIYTILFKEGDQVSFLDKEAFFNRIDAFIGDRSDDDAISFIEDMTDTYTELEKRQSESEDWKKKYSDLDDKWKKRYRKRFFSGTIISDPEVDFDEEKKPEDITIDDLFEEVE